MYQFSCRVIKCRCLYLLLLIIGVNKDQKRSVSKIEADRLSSPYTFLVFHLPLLNKINEAMVIDVSEIGIAANTPVGPHVKYLASR